MPPADGLTVWGRADAAATVRAARTRLAALLRQKGPGYLDKLDAIAAVATADASRVDGAPSLSRHCSPPSSRRPRPLLRRPARRPRSARALSA